MAVGLAVAAGAALFLWGRRAGQAERTAGITAAPRSVLLVTIDTLRADRVGTYGWRLARTPALDGLAARGARFERAFATAPITLTSHASLLTGLYPPGHRGRHNGIRVEGRATTLAEILQPHGFATAAFVAAFPLDRRFGLDQGFGSYSDHLPRAPDGRALNERAGRQVADEAVAWLAAAGTRRFFAWVHFFEPHAPYDADPAQGPARRPATDRYDDEVARADVEVGRVLASLGDRLGSTLVIVAGDHGEAFGEHGEIGHSVFVYDTTLRVPLIVSGPGIGPGAIVHDPVSLVDVVPTVIDLLRLPRRDTDGLSLVPAFEGRSLPARELYAESFAPLLDFGWSSLRSIRRDGQKYVAAPKPELYDVLSDVGETRNLVEARPEVAQALASRVERYSRAELPRDALTPVEEADREARARLQALGYLGSSAAPAPTVRADPKDRRALAARLAQVTSGELQGEALQSALDAILADDPGNAQAHLRLGYVWLEAGDCRRAEPHFEKAIASGVPSADPYLGLAQCVAARGDLRGGERLLRDARRVEPGNPVVEANLGISALAGGRTDAAIEALGAALAIAPDLHEARFNLARAYARAGRREDAAREARTLLAHLPAGAPQRSEVERLLRAVQ